MNSLNVRLEQFIQCFFEPNDTICLRIFADRKGSDPYKGQKLECVASQIGGLMDTLKNHNAQQRGIFFTVNSGGHNDADITRINAQFVESDSASIPEQWEKVNAFALPPSLVVQTAKSLHCYWLMKNAKVEDFRRVQKKLVAQFDGDGNCINESRVLRLPGFYHCKGEPVMVSVVKFSPELRYTQAELEAALPQTPDEPSVIAPAPKGDRKGLALVESRCDFIRHCRENAATLREALWYALITNLAVFDGGDRAIHALSKGYPKYSFDETQAKIAHFLTSGTKPMTCAKLTELGFKCPRLASGECGCKSPAALCYKPLTASELIERLNSFEIRPTEIENIQTLRGFVTEYLYNVEPVIAEPLLNHNAKDRFGFKAPDLRPLLALHREAWKRYSESKEAKRQTEGVELPDWYEYTEKGSVRFLPGVLAEYMAANEPIFYAAEQYYAYSGGVYTALSDLEARAATRRHLIARHTTLNNIADAEGQWRMLIVKPLRELNANPYIINVKNGLYNVLSDEFAPHTPEYCSTVQLNVNYTPNADCPRFRQFLAESLDECDIPLVQEMLGYFLIPINKAQKSFVIVGEPGAGKSKLLLTLNEVLLGQQNVSNIPWQSLNERFKTAELFGKLANIFADLPTKNIDDNGIFKALVGEDFLTAERKNKDPFTFQPYARLLFSCNAIPRNYGDKSEGFYRRLIIMRFSKPVPEDKRDAALLDKFIAEADGIFMFAVEGLKRLIAKQFRFSETENTKAELQRYRVDSNSVLSFIDECCIIEVGAEIERSELFERYRDYCKAAGLTGVSQKTFNRDMETSFPAVKRSMDKLGKRRTWKGVRYGGDI
jgi:putative DNA primase/helicase